MARMSRSKLSKQMTLRQFDHGYWYATEIKRFAQSLGLPSAHKLRKDELEKAIRLFLQSGRIERPVRLNQANEPFARIAHGRYINFASDFLAAEKGATRQHATKAWKKLKARLSKQTALR
jgi:hypothetical protein